MTEINKIESNLVKGVFYDENRDLSLEDKGENAPLYYIELFGKKVTISVSQKYIEEKEDVYAYPIYLINKELNKVIDRIGYYEFPIDGSPEKE